MENELPVNLETRTCRVCNELKPIASFTKEQRNSAGYATICRECKNEDHRRRRAANWENPESSYSKEYLRRKSLELHHNMSYDEYLDLVSDPCEICGTTETQRGLDHVHGVCPSTKHSCDQCRRGPLCDRHNTLIAFADDDIEVLEAAIKYLTMWKEVKELDAIYGTSRTRYP